MTRKNSYTPEQIEWLRTGYQQMNIRDLTAAFNAHFRQNRTRTAISTIITRNKIKCNRAPKDRLINRQRIFTPEQIEYLRENYRDISLADITDKFNRHFGTTHTQTQITTALKNRGINSGRTGHFPKNSMPWNKGKKGVNGASETSFQKGREPWNTNHLWHERISKDGYVEMSVPETNPHTGYHRRYRAKHSWLWEQHNGPIPDGHVVIFKDGNKLNVTTENLILVSRAELLCINRYGYKEAPEEVKSSLLVLAKLETKAGDLRRAK